jgi:hypothetical protein
VKTVKISEAVYEEVARRGKFGETVDDVLRRELGVGGRGSTVRSAQRKVYATRRMTPTVGSDGQADYLQVSFEGGPSKRWRLPAKDDKAGLRSVLHEAFSFAESEGATEGQLKYIRKELNDAGYYLNGPRA